VAGVFTGPSASKLTLISAKLAEPLQEDEELRRRTQVPSKMPSSEPSKLPSQSLSTTPSQSPTQSSPPATLTPSVTPGPAGNCVAGAYGAAVAINQRGGDLVLVWSNGSRPDGAGVIGMVEGGYIIGYMNFPGDRTFALNFASPTTRSIGMAKWARPSTSGQEALL
jgi:hypothetical protein